MKVIAVPATPLIDIMQIFVIEPFEFPLNKRINQNQAVIDRYMKSLEFTRKIFQSGFYWSVIEKKWPGFEEVFWVIYIYGLRELWVFFTDGISYHCSEQNNISNAF